MSLHNPTIWRVLDTLWLLILGIYLFAGMAMVPFHPDETEHLRASQDYVTVFVELNPGSLTDVVDPQTGNFRSKAASLRIIDAQLHGYAMGLAWTFAGLGVDDLPEFWQWTEDFDTNVAEGGLPSPAMLNAGRIASTFVLFLSTIVMFAFGWQINGRWTAYLVTLLYVINPTILFHGRRAMHEAPLLFLGALTLFIAALISQRIEQEKPISWRWWTVLVIFAGLTIAGKHNGIFLVAAAFAWILFAEILKPLRQRDWETLIQTFLRSTGRFIGFGAIALAIFIALSPGFWSDPVGLLQRLFTERTTTIEGQASNINNALVTLPQRVGAMIVQPIVHRDRSSSISSQGSQYFPSLLSGQPLDNLLGWFLMLLVGMGLLVSIRRAFQSAAKTFYAGVIIWLAFVVAMLLTNPLPWQRYYVPLVPVEILLIGIAAHSILNFYKTRMLANAQEPIAF